MSAPAQYPTAPGYGPQYPGQPPMSYPPQSVPQPQQLPQQQYAPQYPQGFAPPPPAMQQAPLAQGSLDDFFSQPSAGGGKSLAFKVVGTRFVGIVTRSLGPGDIQQQTDTMGRPQTFRDGRPKFVMKVPLQMQPSVEHPDGLAVWYVKGQARDELVRAMAAAGAPAGAPEAKAIVDITYVGDRQAGPGMNPAKQFQVAYQRPEGAATAVPAPQPAQPPAQPVQAMAPPATTAPPAQAQQPVQQAAQPQPPADLSADQQALLARLTGQQAS